MPSSARSTPPFLSIAFGYAGLKKSAYPCQGKMWILGSMTIGERSKRVAFDDGVILTELCLFFFFLFSLSFPISISFSSPLFLNFFLDLARLFMFAIVFVAVLYSVLVNNYSLCFDQLSHRDFPLWFPLPYSFLLLILRLFLLSFM